MLVHEGQPPPVVTEPIAAPPLPPPTGQIGRPRSRLGGLAISFVVLALGVLGIVDLAGARVPVAMYLAVPLTVVGLALVVGAWYGRARWLIALGAVLSLGLGIAVTAERIGEVDRDVTWRPSTVEQLARTYTLNAGDAVLDLSALDFTGRSDAVGVDLGVGNLTVVVPQEVDVRVTARADVGNVVVFGTEWAGIGQPTRTVSDVGSDGPGGGELVLEATVDVGNVEVRR